MQPSIDTYSTAVNWNDTLFDDVIDPFEHIALTEREKGREAGRTSGYVEGRDIGLSKGWEIGLELGYIHGLASKLIDGCHNLHQQQSEIKQNAQFDIDADADADAEDQNITSRGRSNQRLDRCLTISRELIEMVDSFPGPDQLLKQNLNISDEFHSAKDYDIGTKTHSKSDGDDTLQEDFNGDSESTKHNDTSNIDITASLQRIRAKFKLLLVLLRTNTPLDLKRMLNPNKRDNQMEGDDEKGVSHNNATKRAVMKGSNW